MEVEEEKTSNHLQESTTTVSNESLLETNSTNDIELEIKVPESSTQEEQGEKSSVVSPKLDDPNQFDAVAVGETAEEKEVIVECGNTEQTGGCRNSVVVEPTSLLKDEKDGAEDAANDVISTSDAAATERGDSELTNSTKLDVGECDAAVILRDNGLDVATENTDTNSSFVIEDDKDGSDDKMETVEVEKAGEALKEGGVAVPLLPVAEVSEREEVMAEDKSDGVEFLVGDEAITEAQADVQVVDAEVVADEDESHGIEKAAGVTENDDEEPTAADEDKLLDTELQTDEEETMADGEEVPTEEMETELPESVVKGGRGKRKRGGKNSKATPKSTAGRKKLIDDEDVCFICFDGGDLVLCDLRTCPKAYHPSCVNRDAAFFQTKGRWNCGWHVCSTCQKKAEYMCYTCTFSLCKACIKKTNVISCVKDKEKKGFCETCMKTIMLIEKNSQENQGNVDFDDKNSWEYLFKDYWLDMKSKLNLSLPDLLEAKSAWKGSDPAGKQTPPAGKEDLPAVLSDGGSGSENPSMTPQPKKKRIRKPRKQKSESNHDLKNTEWASKELLEFVTHMTGGDTSYQSQFDVQALLLEYIKTNKLRDSRRKSYILCDARLERLFGKQRVGHFEMLKLLESHFLIKEDSQIDDVQVDNIVDTEGVQVDNEDEGNENTVKSGKDKKRKLRKKVDREPQSNREDYAAIDTHNISLIYMKRKLVEDLLKDNETFHKKVLGTFVRIRIPGSNNKNDIYRLVQVTGITKTEKYSVGKQMTDSMLEILNLDKTESVSIDTISNQDFTEDECKRLRQSIKCGLINRLKVGDILDKAMELQASRVDDWLEAEVLRLSHLRDRASDLGRKKELRECVEKLQVLKTPEERARRLEDIPVIRDDPAMDPYHVSDDESDEDDKKQDMYKSSVGPRFNQRRDYPSKEHWSGTSTSRGPTKNYEFTRNSSFSSKPEPHNEHLRDQGRDTVVQQPIIPKKTEDPPSTKENPETAPKENEVDKMWHYKDPSGKIQGPFSMVQLRKWNNSKFFPVDLRIWRKSEKEDDGVVLTDALEGRFTPVKWGPKHDERDGFGSLPSPTPNQNPKPVFSGNEGLQSPTPSGPGPRLAAFGGGGSCLPPQMVQPVADPSVSGGSYGWSGGGAPNNLQPSPSSNVGGQQQLGFNQWSGVPNIFQNPHPAGNFLPPPPPVPAPVNLQQQPPPPQQPNISWQPPPGNQNMNWGPQLTGTINVNSPWGLQAGGGGWAGAPAAQGWVPGPSQGPIVSGNGNPSWVGPPNPGEVNTTSSGWGGGPGSGNSGIGWGPPSNQGWGSPTPARNRDRDRGMWENQNYNTSGGFSGQKRTNRGRGSGFHGDRRH